MIHSYHKDRTDNLKLMSNDGWIDESGATKTGNFNV